MPVTKADNLACPLDGLPLRHSDKQYICSSGHSFDEARQAYINLLPVQHKSSKNPGDSKEMIDARTDFLNTGLYQPVAEKLTEVVSNLISEHEHDNDMCLLDAGCGEGYYLDYLLNNLDLIANSQNISFVGLDISKPAIIAASKRNKQVTWLVASNKQIPVLPATVDLITCMFGFPVYESFRRILKPSGKIVLVDAGPSHLIELRKLIYPTVKDSKPFDKFTIDEAGYRIIEQQQLTYNIVLDSNSKIMQLLGMTPHLYRASKEGKQAAIELEMFQSTVDVWYRVLE